MAHNLLQAVLNEGIKDFSINEIDVYNNNYVGKENNLYEYLVPIIYKDQLDDIAKDFLNKYYPEALEEPIKINTEELANRVELSIEHLNPVLVLKIFNKLLHSYLNRGILSCSLKVKKKIIYDIMVIYLTIKFNLFT